MGSATPLSLPRTLSSYFLLIGICLGGACSGVGPSDLSHAEDWFPAVLKISRFGRIPKSRTYQSTLGPSVVDTGKMPVHCVGGSVSVELVTDIDQLLHRCDVDIVDGTEI